MSRKYKLVVFIPLEAIEAVKKSIFDAGAGRLGSYDRCSWQTKGLGQFRPLSGSKPYLGKENLLEQVEEWRLETLVESSCLENVLDALKQAHPYEEPAFDLISLEN